MALFPGFRSKERDIETDMQRVAPIANAVQKALREAEHELQGLNARVASEDSIRGKSRVRYISDEIAALRQVQALLDGIESPDVAASARR
jgi:hypothetical protein